MSVTRVRDLQFARDMLAFFDYSPFLERMSRDQPKANHPSTRAPKAKSESPNMRIQRRRVRRGVCRNSADRAYQVPYSTEAHACMSPTGNMLSTTIAARPTLMLFCLRALRPGLQWKERPLAIAFWSINVGLAAMVVLSMLPVGLMQAWASVEYGTWYARSAEFLQTPLLTRLRWMRMFGDSLFAFGALVLGWFVLGLVTGHSFEKGAVVEEGEHVARELEVAHSGD